MAHTVRTALLSQVDAVLRLSRQPLTYLMVGMSAHEVDRREVQQLFAALALPLLHDLPIRAVKNTGISELEDIFLYLESLSPSFPLPF